MQSNDQINERTTHQPNAVVQLGNHLLATKFQFKWNNTVHWNCIELIVHWQLAWHNKFISIAWHVSNKLQTKFTVHYTLVERAIRWQRISRWLDACYQKEDGGRKSIEHPMKIECIFGFGVCEIHCECVAESRKTEQLHAAHVLYHDWFNIEPRTPHRN